MTVAPPLAQRKKRHPKSPGSAAGAFNDRPTLAKQRLRLWLRMLRVSRGIEADLRVRLRVTYDLTLPQFDVLAALARRDNGVTMTELSRYLMVSNGNVTGIVDRLVNDGLIERIAVPADRRSTLVRLSAVGRTTFARMATEHEIWVNDLLDLYDPAEVADLITSLDGLVEKLRAAPRARATKSKEGKTR